MFTSLKYLLSSIVDYAGLFPPAQLSLPEAITIYDRARSSPHHWMLDRFVLPASRLHEISNLPITTDETRPAPDPPHPWLLSVILSNNWASELEQIHQTHTHTEYGDRMKIVTLEVAPVSPTAIPQICDRLPATMSPFFEIPFDVALEPYLDVLQQTNAAAKLRTGGITSAAFPDPIQLAQRILALAKAPIPFKATAGLHHPLRSSYRLTDQPHSATATMHGFLNVAILAAFACDQDMVLSDAAAILQTQSIDLFQFTDTVIGWRDRTLSLDAIQRSRQQFFRSFGSCSFEEAIADLHHLGLLQKS